MIPANARQLPALAKGMLVKETREGGETYRIVWLEADLSNIWLFRIRPSTDPIEWPFALDGEDFTNGLGGPAPIYKIVYEEIWPLKAHFDVDSKSSEHHRKSWEIATALTADDNEHGLLFATQRKRIIDQVAAELSITRPTAVNTIQRYWQRGMCFSALCPGYDRCGGPGKQRNGSPGKKIGRRRTITVGIGLSTNEELRRLLQIATDYLHHKECTYDEALRYILDKFFSETVINDGKVEVVISPDAPTRRQLEYFHKTSLSYDARIIRSKGQRAYDLRHRATLGRGDDGTRGPGDRFQLDATVADVYLRSRFDRSRIVGRPVIYFVIDVWSRMIVGLYVGFEGPSWAGAMMALANTVTPKVEYCRQFGIEIDPSTWPCHHLPQKLLGDRGELMAVDPGARFVEQTRVEIENVRGGRGDMKSIVEPRFGIVQTGFKPFVPGYVKPDFRDRGARDYRLDASLDLFEFNQMMIYGVLKHNTKEIRDLSVPAAMTSAGLGAIPVELWNWGIPNRSGLLRTIPVDLIELAVMPRATATVTQHGIRIHGAYYSCEEAERLHWFSQARQRTWRGEACYDPRALEKVYFLDGTSPRGYHVCRSLDPDLTGKSLFEFEEKNLAAQELSAARAPKKQGELIQYDRRMAEIEAAARSKTEAIIDPNAPKSRALRAIRENRRTEKARQRREEHFDLSDDVVPRASNGPFVTPSGAQEFEDEEDNELAFLRKLKLANREK